MFFIIEKVIGQESKDTTDISWADSVLSTLSLDEKIAQLLMVRTYSNKNAEYYTNTEALIRKYNIGGLCFFQGGPVRQAKLTNRYQKAAKTPLLIALDAEWGLGMRLDSTYSFPYQMTLGALRNNDLIYEMGAMIAKQLKMIGTHINFAPVADVNNNEANPVINSRSFGESEWDVAQKSIAYMQGLQDNGIIATAKHFPGHGDTDTDSHYALPVIKHSRERLDSIELYPFRMLIERGIDAVMIAHLLVTSLDSTPNTPTTLSKKVVTDLLKTELGFKGLVVTDALDMKGVTENHRPGEIELKAFLAGNDILLLPQDVEAAVAEIKNAVDTGLITEAMIDERCLKVLQYKEKAGLNNYKPVITENLYQRLNGIENEVLVRKIYEEAVTVLINDSAILPVNHFDTLKTASLAIGSTEINDFQKMLANYAMIEHYNTPNKFTHAQADDIISNLAGYDLIIISVHKTTLNASKNFGLTPETFQLIDKLSEKKKVILALFSNPYGLSSIMYPEKLAAVVMGYQDNQIANEIVAQIIMGSMGSRGKLPVFTNDSSFFHSGIELKSIHKLKYSLPEEMGIASKDLNKIDSIVLLNIREGAFPGCQVLVAKEGRVIYRKSFGNHIYGKSQKVEDNDLYDLASLTKMAATTLAVMKLYDEKKLDIDQTLSHYLPELKGTNKEDIVIRDLMVHQARLKAWIPFYLDTTKDKKPDPKFYTIAPDSSHQTQVAKNLFIKDDYKGAIYDSIVTSTLLKKKEYVYSDLGFYFLCRIVESLTAKPLDEYCNEVFYKPLGLKTMCFNPLNRFELSDIVPTENDDYFRNQLVHGYVHDPGAAMFGGVAGHAGLFSNAGDIAVIMQMLLQEGEYGGRQYLAPETVREFTKQQFPLDKNRRGIGFDKPDPEIKEDGPTCDSVSNSSYGHTGFTGTYAWADPEYDLVYIFLSNRIYPTAKNTKINKMKTRKSIQQVIYDAILKAEKRKKDKPYSGISKDELK
jgi:beta-glucosidase-like glycosyl hydrolase/CubicO group peptidase (beta-lactamase class C family)